MNPTNPSAPVGFDEYAGSPGVTNRTPICQQTSGEGIQLRRCGKPAEWRWHGEAPLSPIYLCGECAKPIMQSAGPAGFEKLLEEPMPGITVSLRRLPNEPDLAYYARILTPSKPTIRDAAPAATPDDGPRLTEEQLRAGRERAYQHLKPVSTKAKR